LDGILLTRFYRCGDGLLTAILHIHERAIGTSVLRPGFKSEFRAAASFSFTVGNPDGQQGDSETDKEQIETSFHLHPLALLYVRLYQGGEKKKRERLLLTRGTSGCSFIPPVLEVAQNGAILP
jgi:hypothetical protein